MKWPKYSKIEIKLVEKILKSGKVNYWTGKYCKIFEKNFANYFKIKYACAVANASVGLECALKALDIKKNDKIIVPAKSYFSSASCIVNVGAIPIFSDIDLNSQNISIDNIKKVYTKSVKAIICVHLGGYPCDLEPIIDFAKKKKYQNN